MRAASSFKNNTLNNELKRIEYPLLRSKLETGVAAITDITGQGSCIVRADSRPGLDE